MTRTLIAEDGRPRLLAPTTTTKLAHRMLRASQTVVEHLPRGIAGSPALDILLALYVAEEEARYPSADELAVAGTAAAARERWIAYLAQLGLVDRRDDLLALSAEGHATVTGVIEALFAVQRALD